MFNFFGVAKYGRTYCDAVIVTPCPLNSKKMLNGFDVNPSLS